MKEGDTYRVLLNGFRYTVKAHVMYILEGCYEGEKLIVFRYYGKYKQWWHQDMLREMEFEGAVLFAKKHDNY